MVIHDSPDVDRLALIGIRRDDLPVGIDQDGRPDPDLLTVRDAVHRHGAEVGAGRIILGVDALHLETVHLDGGVEGEITV